MRGIRDRDHLETSEGFIFTVVGHLHPKDRAVAYLKYVPSAEGKWQRADTRYRRILQRYSVPSVIETEEFLRKSHPEYLFRSEIMGIETTCVPLDRVSHWYRPEKKLAELATTAKLDALQKKSVQLVQVISDSTGVSMSSLGIAGSILLGLHNPLFSDIDLAVYGYNDSVKVRDVLKQMVRSTASPIVAFDKARAERWCLDKEKNHPISKEEAAKILERKWNKGVFQGIEFSIHPVRIESEINEVYGEMVYRSLGLTTVEAEVTDGSESIFIPAIYKIFVRKIVSGHGATRVNEVISFEGLYCDSAYEGEHILVRGLLEEVFDKRLGSKSERIVVGAREAKGVDFIKVLHRRC